ncbi:hypothetical protein DFQ07_1603 [Tenacibaculum caenipelagi]|uniref:Uncharacterized protein n=1 Tax=Tenacibaculum caenipelagi TaxID=1325435 RepID=A0A4R6TE20_9FLAO|nr:hypothetical protein DFQ07_1603 [Tenacibaculum caenipelagi]
MKTKIYLFPPTTFYFGLQGVDNEEKTVTLIKF